MKKIITHSLVSGVAKFYIDALPSNLMDCPTLSGLNFVLYILDFSVDL